MIALKNQAMASIVHRLLDEFNCEISNCVDKEGNNVLMYLLMKNTEKIIKKDESIITKIISKCTEDDFTHKNNTQDDALFYCCREGSTIALEKLLAAHNWNFVRDSISHPGIERFETVFNVAGREGNINIIKELCCLEVKYDIPMEHISNQFLDENLFQFGFSENMYNVSILLIEFGIISPGDYVEFAQTNVLINQLIEEKEMEKFLANQCFDDSFFRYEDKHLVIIILEFLNGVKRLITMKNDLHFDHTIRLHEFLRTHNYW